MTSRRACGAVLALALALGACSGDGEDASQGSVGGQADLVAGQPPPPPVKPVTLEGPATFGVEEVPEELLSEARVDNRNLELIDRTRQDRDFCQGWGAITAIAEPDPKDLPDLVDWGTNFYNSLKRIDQRSRVPNPRGRQGQTMSLPDEVKEHLDNAQAAMHAYTVRLAHISARAGARDKTTPEQVDAYLRYAFLKLASGPFATADTVLGRFYTETCQR